MNANNTANTQIESLPSKMFDAILTTESLVKVGIMALEISFRRLIRENQ